MVFKKIVSHEHSVDFDFSHMSSSPPPSLPHTAKSSESSCPTTRAQNAHVYPGLQVQGQKRHRRTKAQIEADNKQAGEEKLTKDAKKKAGLKKIATIEARQENEISDVTPRPTRKAAQKHTSSHAHIPLHSDDNSQTETEGPAASDLTYEYQKSSIASHDGDSDVNEDLELPAAKKPKTSQLKAKETSQPAHKEGTQPRGGKEDGEMVVDNIKKVPHGKIMAKSVYVIGRMTSKFKMLTLDETTLFYFSLYSTSKNNASGIIGWNSKVASFNPALKPKGTGAASSSKSSLITTKSSTHSTSKSVLNESVLITDQSDRGAIHTSEEGLGGLQDEDETIGEERDLAITSPIKGKTRLTSTVASTTYQFGYRTEQFAFLS